MKLSRVTLEDKYTLRKGQVFVTGMQALTRLPMLQRERDVADGLNTAGFISGYRGSPLGNYDQALWQAQEHLDDHHIRFVPGINEVMAGNAVWGTQQSNLFGTGVYDGVFGIWYGKGPGVDISGDVLKHGNFAGSAANGGVLVLAGDDHTGKSSTTAHQSEQALIAAMIPILNPANLQEYLDFGLYGFALSRFSGCWVGFKCATQTAEGSATVMVDPARVKIKRPSIDFPEGGLNIRWPDFGAHQEERLIRHKLPAAQAFIEANGLDRVTHDADERNLGIVTTGKVWLDVLQALQELGIDEKKRRALGLRIYKVAMPWPLVTSGIRDFAKGHKEILVLEEKRNLMEDQIARALYGLYGLSGASGAPRLVGKQDERGKMLVKSDGELGPHEVALIIADRLRRMKPPKQVDRQLEKAQRRLSEPAVQAPEGKRIPWFCAGCPHNTSTRVPEGSRAMGGIGCHTITVLSEKLSRDRNTQTYTQMGGEGGNWIGQAPFCSDGHVFQNMGDGTYIHSGRQAINAAVAANVNITFKILYNDAVALTGGQPFDGELTPWKIAHQCLSDGAKSVVVVAEDPDRYKDNTPWPDGVDIYHRDDLDRVQRDLRETKGVTILIYDQVCAAEKRRRRKRGRMEDPAKFVFINEEVCEGCGDCGMVSNCVAIRPVETEFGRKRQIDQSVCNKDYSCLKGFCPALVTVYGGEIRKPPRAAAKNPAKGLKAPKPAVIKGAYNILVTGIGGTGVVTIGAILGMAANIEKKGSTVLDQTGLSQKNGAVASHVRISSSAKTVTGTRIPDMATDLALGCDLVTATDPSAMQTYSPGRTHAVVNDHVVPLSDFALVPDMDTSNAPRSEAMMKAAGAKQVDLMDSTRLAEALLGDAIYANMFLLGYAAQKGLLPVSVDAINRAIELNNVAVEDNLLAFAWGRRAAADIKAVLKAAEPQLKNTAPEEIATSLEEIIAKRRAFLVDYQNEAYARRYEDFIDRVRAAERSVMKGRTDLSKAVAKYYFKLLAYKDEYEVARLYAEGSFRDKIKRQFAGRYTVKANLAPPFVSFRDKVTKRPIKKEYDSEIFLFFRLLAKLRGLRGTRFDPFGYTKDRRLERRLIREYEETITRLIEGLRTENYGLAVEIASIPEHIRGFGYIKERSVQDAKANETNLLERFDGVEKQSVAAE